MDELLLLFDNIINGWYYIKKNNIGSLEVHLLLVGCWRSRDTMKALKGKDAEGCSKPEGCILI